MTHININATVAEYVAEFEFCEALVYSLQDLGLKIIQNMPEYAQLPDEDKILLKRVIDNHAWATFFNSLVGETYVGVKDLYLQKAKEVFETLVDLTQILIDRYDRITEEFDEFCSIEQLTGLKKTYEDQYAETNSIIDTAKTFTIYRERLSIFTMIALCVLIVLLGRDKSKEYVDGINKVIGSLRIHQIIFNKSLASQQMH